MADTLLNFENVRQVLEDYADFIASEYRGNLSRSGRNASGKLSSSVRAYVESGERWYEVRMRLEEYWKYIEYGTRPHWPPIEAIRRWVEIKPVIPRPDSRGRIPTPKQLAYLIARKISRVGTQGKPDLATAEEQANARFMARLKDALEADMGAYITRVFRDNNTLRR